MIIDRTTGTGNRFRQIGLDIIFPKLNNFRNVKIKTFYYL